MRLQVTVQLRGEIIEDRVLNAYEGLCLGSRDGAAVAFPGLDLVVHLDDDAVVVRGQHLRDGDRLELGVDDVVVTLAPVAQALLPRTPIWRGDIVLPVMLAAMVLLTLTGQTVTEVLRAKADVSEGVARRVEALLLPARAAAPQPSPVLPWHDPVDTWSTPARYVESVD